MAFGNASISTVIHKNKEVGGLLLFFLWKRQNEVKGIMLLWDFSVFWKMSQHTKDNRIRDYQRTTLIKCIQRRDWLISYLNTQNKWLFLFFSCIENCHRLAGIEILLQSAHILDEVVNDCLHAVPCTRPKIKWGSKITQGLPLVEVDSMKEWH